MPLKSNQPRGILKQKAGEAKFQLTRYEPSEDLAFFVEHYWMVRWDLSGQEPYVQEILPHPSVHLVFEPGKTNLFGVIVEGRFTRVLQGRGVVLGIKFKPGAAYPFLQMPVSQFADDTISLEEAFGVDSRALEQEILTLGDEERMVGRAEQFLRGLLPERDENVALIQQVIARIEADRDIAKVDDLAERMQINKRTLQRLFSQYVGASPKWVIKRFRLHEAAEQIAAGTRPDWPQLAADLGYYDQAHFIKDFKTIVGKSPEEYAKEM